MKLLYNLKIMPARIVSDEGKPSAAIEIPLEKPLPDYDLDQIDQPTPRDVDGILVSQGFRDLVDDSRGILMDLLSNEPHTVDSSHGRALNLSHANEHSLQVEQLTGAICPGTTKSIARVCGSFCAMCTRIRRPAFRWQRGTHRRHRKRIRQTLGTVIAPSSTITRSLRRNHAGR